MTDYEQMARKMREVALTYKGGNLEVSPELWEEIAEALEKKPQGFPVVELLQMLVSEKKAEIILQPNFVTGMDGMVIKIRKDGMQYAIDHAMNPELSISQEEAFFHRLSKIARVVLKEGEIGNADG